MKRFTYDEGSEKSSLPLRISSPHPLPLTCGAAGCWIRRLHEQYTGVSHAIVVAMVVCGKCCFCCFGHVHAPYVKDFVGTENAAFFTKNEDTATWLELFKIAKWTGHVLQLRFGFLTVSVFVH